MQRIKQTKQDFIVLLSETKETLDEQLALPQAERDAALIAECLETLDYIKGEANLPEGAFAFDSIHFNSLQEIPLLQYSVRRAQKNLNQNSPRRGTLPLFPAFFCKKLPLPLQ